MEQLTATTLPWEKRLRGIDPDVLAHRAKQIAELTDHPGWKFLTEIVQEEISQHRDAILPPKVHSHVEYVAITNQEFGMRVVLDAPKAVRILSERVEEERRRAAELVARKEQR